MEEMARVLLRGRVRGVGGRPVLVDLLMAESMPTEGDLLNVAIMHHEIFLSYVKAGFTESQALELLKAWIPRPNPGEG